MKKFFLFYIVAIIVLFLICICGCDSSTESGNGNIAQLTGAFLGQDPPGQSPQLFAPQIFTADIELHSPPVFSPDGQEVFWSPMDGVPSEIKHMKIVNGVWSTPAYAPFNSVFGCGDPSFSPDGNKIFFMSWQSSTGNYETNKENIWMVERSGSNWGEPQMLSNAVNRLDVHWQVSVASNGNLYFAGEEIGGDDDGGIYSAEFINGEYANAELMGSSINTQYYEGTPFIAPDESYLIFSRFGGYNPYSDLFISYKNEDGTWTAAQNMGPTINSGGHELYAYVTTDGGYMFFLSTRDGLSKAYWVSAQIISDLRQCL